MSLIESDISALYSDVSANSNSTANQLYGLLDAINTNTAQVSSRISVLSDMLTDLIVLNGSASNIKYLSTLPIISNTGIEIDHDTDSIQLAKTSETLCAFNNTACSISSLNAYTISDSKGTPSSLSRMLKTSQEIKVEFSNVGYNISINLIFPDYISVNTLNLRLGIATESYPLISRITYNDVHNELQDAVVLSTRASSLDLNSSRVLNNKYTISLNTIITNQINVSLTDRTNSSLSVVSLYASNNTYEATGTIVFGPIHMNSPILKTSIDSNSISDGIKISISPDNVVWTPLTNSSSLSISGDRKTVAFNTINERSFKSTEDITNLYIKMVMTSSILKTDSVNIYKIARSDQSVSPNIDIAENKFSGYRIKPNYLNYGGDVDASSISTGTLNTSMIDGISIGGVTKALGLIDTDISITPNSSLIGNILITSKRLRIPSDSLIDATHFDVGNGVVTDIYLKAISGSNINTNTKGSLCIKICVPEDVYVVSSSAYTVKINLTTPYVNNLLSTILIVPKDTIIVKNSVGNVIKTILPEELLEIIIEDKIYYAANLVDILYTLPKLIGLEPCPAYPLIALPSDSWSMVDGEIISSASTIVNYTGYEAIRTLVEVVKVVDYTNGNYINRIDENYTYYHKQVVNNATTSSVIKLQHVSIKPGTVTITPFINTSINTYVPTSESTHRYINVGTTTDPAQLIIDNTTNDFLEE